MVTRSAARRGRNASFTRHPNRTQSRHSYEGLLYPGRYSFESKLVVQIADPGAAFKRLMFGGG
jgi:hypothetical protein